MANIPFTRIGLESITLISEVSPFVQELPDALFITTGAGPVTVKSLPSGAMELHFIGLLKTNTNVSFIQITGRMLSIGVGTFGINVSVALSPTGSPVAQLS